MKTQILSEPAEAAELLRDGRLVAFPTETVYGLGVDATNSEAVLRLFLAKGRPSDNPLIVHVSAVDDWRLAARECSPVARRLLQQFAPGPLTVVLPKQTAIPAAVTAGLDTVGVRIPDSELALQMLRQCRRPIAAPSANRSGRPSCTTWQSVLEDLDGRIDAVLRGPDCRVGLESSVVDCSGPQTVLLREGAVSFEAVQQVAADTQRLGQVTESSNSLVNSPGLRHAHYQPAARVVLVDWRSTVSQLDTCELAMSAYAGITPPPEMQRFAWQCHFSSVAAFAHGYYEFLRETDRRSLQCAVVELARGDGLATALADRQLRSAAGNRSNNPN